MTRFKGLLVRFLCLMWVSFVPLCMKSQSVKVTASFDKESKIFRWELENMTDSVVRIHIRANSNSVIDQEVKLLVRDSVIDYITPLIADCGNAEDVKDVLEQNIEDVEFVADCVLLNNGFNYSSNAKIKYKFVFSKRIETFFLYSNTHIHYNACTKHII